MKAIVQRVKKASVKVEDKVVGKVGSGFLVLLGVRRGDTIDDALFLARKTVALRIFSDLEDKMNLSLADVNGGVLVISQFTLYADTRKGNRPSFIMAAEPEMAKSLYEAYVNELRREIGNEKVETGIFGASMLVEIHNDGPVTVELSTDKV